MKIEFSNWENDYGDMHSQKIKVYNKEGIKRFEVSVSDLSECPEDAIIGRNLIDCNDIISYMEEAWEAGKRGEDFKVEEVPYED